MQAAGFTTILHASRAAGSLGALSSTLGQRGGVDEVFAAHVSSHGGLRHSVLPHCAPLSYDVRGRRMPVIVAVVAGRGTEGATEEETESVAASALQAPPLDLPSRPLPSPATSGVSEDPEAVANSLDRIELQAKSSIDRLKHILYKLKTRPNVAETTVIEASGQVDGVNNTLSSSSTIVKEDEREIYISQKIEVDMTPVEENDVEVETDVGSSSLDVVPEAADSVISETVEELAVPDSLVQYDSLTCTSTTVQFDEENQTAIVTVTATVRGADLKSQTAYTERTIAMAARALTRTCLALDEKAQLALVGSGPLAEILPSTKQKQHDDVLRQLALGRIVSMQPIAEGSTPFRQVYDMTLVTEDGQQVEATFKPMLAGDVHGRWKRAPCDWVAYQMASMLGIDMVPPTVIRRDINFAGQEFPVGSVSLKVTDARPLSSVLPQNWGESAAATAVSNTHILDALLGNAPRRKEAFKAGVHWTGKGEVRPLLLEHPMGPGLGHLHSMWSQRGEMKGVKCISALTLSRLRGLNRGMLLETLSGALTAEEMELVLEKRDQVVSYFDAMASRHGRHLVIR